MRSMMNALVWIGLTVGLPSVLYAMTVVPQTPEPTTPPHQPDRCAVCRHYRTLGTQPVPFQDDDMILVSPGHPIVTGTSAGQDDSDL